jgi:hypothetical protein
MDWQNPATLLAHRLAPYDGSLGDCLQYWETLSSRDRQQAVITVLLPGGGRRSIASNSIPGLLGKYRDAMSPRQQCG